MSQYFVVQVSLLVLLSSYYTYIFLFLQFIALHDVSGDGLIQFDEFAGMMELCFAKKNKAADKWVAEQIPRLQDLFAGKD